MRDGSERYQARIIEDRREELPDTSDYSYLPGKEREGGVFMSQAYI
jgi:hypothetical protein